MEHAEIEEKPIHQTFSGFVQSGMAFGANRWLAVLQRQCERLASLMARNISDVGGGNLVLNIIIIPIRIEHQEIVLRHVFDVIARSDIVAGGEAEHDEAGAEDDQNVLREHKHLRRPVLDRSRSCPGQHC